jgi:lysozyme
MAQKKSKKPKRNKSKEDISTAKAFFYVFSFFVFLTITVFSLHYKHALQLYFCANYNKFCSEVVSNEIQTDLSFCKSVDRKKVNAFNIRNIEVLEKHKEDHIFGIDISEYQGEIDWYNVYCVEDVAKIDFVILRATAGIDKVDLKFKDNWPQVKTNKFVRGAYHYYRADEDPIEQATNFITTVKLYKSDLPPILDVEKLPKKISQEQFIQNVKLWMDKVEKHYGIQPILYSGQSFHEDFLAQHFPNHYLWIANYSFFKEAMHPDWHIWQFSEKGYVSGIKTHVDLNVFKGSLNEFKQLTIK